MVTVARVRTGVALLSLTVSARMNDSLAAKVIERFVAGQGWQVETLDGGGVVTALEQRHGFWACVLTPLHDEEVVLIESIAPLTVPSGKFTVVAELLALINDDLLLGALVVDAGSGIVRGRDAVDVEALDGAVEDPVALGAAMIASPVATNIATMDRWLAAISVVVNGDTVPADAVAAVESRP
jgi:hypothetical protein